MNIRELKKSKYLKKEDCEPPLQLTMNEVRLEDVGADGGQDERHVLYFQEEEKGMVLNSTNGQLIADITGSEESSEWAGKKIELYHERNVFFAGKRTGGIRVREITQSRPPQTKPHRNVEMSEASSIEDEIPF